MSNYLARWARSRLTLNRDREYCAVLMRLRPEPFHRLLDVGCGDGFWTYRFAGHFNEVTGLDPSDELLGYAKGLYSAPNLCYVPGTAESLPFGDSTFDAVVSLSSVEHFADAKGALEEMYRVLRPGGRLAVSVDSLLAENSDVQFRDWHRRRHYVNQYFSASVLTRLLEQAGFELDPQPMGELFRSRLACRVRQHFLRHPRRSIWLFPLFWVVVRLADRMLHRHAGQILVASATRVSAAV